MEGLGPVDLFATKGVEYLIVIGFLIVLTAYWRLLSRPAPEPRAVRVERRGWFTLKDGVYFHQGHSWAAPAGGDVVSVGMDDFAHKLLGKPDAFRLPPVGSKLRQGERAWTVKIDSKAIGVLSPVDGKVVGINPAILDSPELANHDPYDEGWLMKVRVQDPARAAKNLLSGRLARAWMEATAERLREMRAGELGVVLPDGGFPVDGFARCLSPDRWDELAEQFLLIR